MFKLPEGVTREVMEADVLIVGGGSAGLSCALELSKLIKAHNKTGSPLEPTIMVLEKGADIGAHSLSGAVLDPSALKDLIPDFFDQKPDLFEKVTHDAVYYLTNTQALGLPIVPEPFQNENNYIISVSSFNRWLGELCEQEGIMVFPGFAAVDTIIENNAICGVITGDKGRDKNGNPKANFEPGLEIRAKVTLFAEGPRGSLFKSFAQKTNLPPSVNPQVFEEGVKEVIQCPKGSVTPGQVIHTMGYPLSKSIGGSFIYTLKNDQIAIGLVTYLDSPDPLLDPHRELQKLKTHPFIFDLIKGGQVIAYGGKTLPAGGWYSRPQIYGNGWLVAGDSASFVDVQKLKGIHLAMRSGMLAAETIFKALVSNNYSSEVLSHYQTLIESSQIKAELYPIRNFHQALSQGFALGLPQIALQKLTGGRGLKDPQPCHTDSSHTDSTLNTWGPSLLDIEALTLPKPDGKLFFDKLGSVYLTGTQHDEDSPNHLLVANKNICSDECAPKFNSPCTHFCPAQVYEMREAKPLGSSHFELEINYTNCIHCKTCDIKCPFDNILWTPPQGGGGPKYQLT